MRYNHHFANHFGSCRLLVEGYDPHRNRKIQVRQLPGEFDVVGVTDGTDAWVAPISVAPSPLFDKVRRVMEDIKAGKNPPVVDAEVRERRKISIPTEPDPPTPARRRIALPVEETPTPRTRRVITSA